MNINLDNVLVWRNQSALSQYHYLCQNPPLRSVVIEFHPVVAEQLLAIANTKNRTMRKDGGHLAAAIAAREFELTGDTIKFARSGRLLDGQHRLRACVAKQEPMTTHVVFGLEERIFDTLDQGAKRTVADVIGMEGVSNPNIVAGAIRWAELLENQDVTANKRVSISPRHARQVLSGEMAGIEGWIKHGLLINAAYKHPPSLIAAICFVAAKHNPKLADDFIHEWLHGARIGRNTGFDILSARLHKIRQQSGGIMHNVVRAALIVTLFNHWQAGITPSARALTWNHKIRFPKMIFEKFTRVDDFNDDHEEENLPAINGAMEATA